MGRLDQHGGVGKHGLWGIRLVFGDFQTVHGRTFPAIAVVLGGGRYFAAGFFSGPVRGKVRGFWVTLTWAGGLGNVLPEVNRRCPALLRLRVVPDFRQ